MADTESTSRQRQSPNPSRPKPRKRKGKNPEGQMPLREHLKELRNRLIKAGLGLVVGTVIGFLVYQPAFEILTDPVTRLSTPEEPAEIVFSSVAQPFDIMLQVALFLGIIISSPVWLYQLWAFIMPGLRKKEKLYALGFIAAALPLFVAGVGIGWLAMPQILEFFTSLTPGGTAHRIQATVYIPFILRLLLSFGVALILPVIMVGLNMAGVLSGKQILKHWRISVFIIALVSAMASPGGDVITMFYMALPLTALFLLALGLCLWLDRRRKKRDAKKAHEFEAEIQRGATPTSEL